VAGDRHETRLMDIGHPRLTVPLVANDLSIRQLDIAAYGMPRFATGQVPDTWPANFRQEFQKRFAATSSEFWESVRRRRVRPEDVNLLSTFHSTRMLAREVAQLNASQWDKWLQ